MDEVKVKKNFEKKKAKNIKAIYVFSMRKNYWCTFYCKNLKKCEFSVKILKQNLRTTLV